MRSTKGEFIRLGAMVPLNYTRLMEIYIATVFTKSLGLTAGIRLHDFWVSTASAWGND